MPRPACLGVLAVLLVLTAPAAARERRNLHLRFPRFALPPGADKEVCVFVRIPRTTPFDLASIEIRHRGFRQGAAANHFLVYLYTGERLAEFAADAGRVVESRACLDLGPADRDRRQLIAAGFAVTSRIQLPRGLVRRLAPVPAAPGGAADGIGILLDANWVNGGTRTRLASTRVVLRGARRRDVRRAALPLFDNAAESGLEVPPLEVRSATGVWGPGLPGGPAGDVCLLDVTGHYHDRGRFFGVDLIGTDGLPRSERDGPSNPFDPGQRYLFAATDFTDPGTRDFLREGERLPLVRAGESLRYTCWHDNGVNRAVRLGCEEVAGQPPGGAGAASKPCTAARSASPECPAADAVFPGRQFTGACVPASLTAGSTPDDEVCALAGAYFEAVPGAPAGEECNVGLLASTP
jgi:hypothetical protein